MFLVTRPPAQCVVKMTIGMVLARLPLAVFFGGGNEFFFQWCLHWFVLWLIVGWLLARVLAVNKAGQPASTNERTSFDWLSTWGLAGLHRRSALPVCGVFILLYQQFRVDWRGERVQVNGSGLT